ncbi:16S rRNA (uracil(1498)-N(3))-methyltransferase [Ekhidna sp.]
MAIFYEKELSKENNSLSEEESRHCSQVLRHQEGDEIMIYDGNGGKHRANLTRVSKKVCDFKIIESNITPEKEFEIHLGIAPTKSIDRMEWLIEKLSEIGVDQVTFIQTKHSERKKIRLDRLEKKAVSAMKQSGNPFLMKINELISIDQFLKNDSSDIKLIAHVDKTHQYITKEVEPSKSISVLIGPEGDFSIEEVNMAKATGFKAVSIGENTLRTETAGFVACCFVNTINQY